MNSKNRLFAIALVVLAMTLGACSTTADMDEIIDHTEINAPSDPKDENGGGSDDEPGGRLIGSN